ncbi:unnamed protein product [Acanthosepion pharaonis]|uniref:Uncharacterized protein n=1 Tax=Acanthosepion pharaonis TaxID=158019 RepID=A0A812C801_ACAPH|nr:unnamed protein product [Sepia pharaonis]
MLFLMLATCVSSCPRIVKIKNLRRKYHKDRRLVTFTCKLGFELVGAKTAVCNQNKWSTEPPICIAPGCPLLEYDDNVLDVTYTYRGSLATFQCKANYVMEDEDNRVYCNKREWNKPPPVCKKNSVRKSCDYEDGICGWTQDLGDDFDWKIHSKKTSTRYTGPSNDHTYGNVSEGHYIYTEASAPRRPGDQARLLSPLYNFKMQAVCFEFWFHMWCPSLTKETGSLQIYAISKKQLLTNLAPLMTLTGDYGNSWKRKRIQLEPMQDTFQIILQTTSGENHKNDIAIDDIQLWGGLCEDTPNITNPFLTKILMKITTPISFPVSYRLLRTGSPAGAHVRDDDVPTDRGLFHLASSVSLDHFVLKQGAHRRLHQQWLGAETRITVVRAGRKKKLVSIPTMQTPGVTPEKPSLNLLTTATNRNKVGRLPKGLTQRKNETKLLLILCGDKMKRINMVFLSYQPPLIFTQITIKLSKAYSFDYCR